MKCRDIPRPGPLATTRKGVFCITRNTAEHRGNPRRFSGSELESHSAAQQRHDGHEIFGRLLDGGLGWQGQGGFWCLSRGCGVVVVLRGSSWQGDATWMIVIRTERICSRPVGYGTPERDHSFGHRNNSASKLCRNEGMVRS